MAQKRMFDKAIIETDAFLNVSLSAKALYFLLGMECDDEGFVSPTRVLRLYGGEMGDVKNLVDVGLVIRFNSGVLVITDWNQNNYLDKNRIKPTQYKKEKQMLLLTEQGKYELNGCLTDVQPEEYRGEEKSIEENTSEATASQINEIISLFKEVNPSYEKFYSNKTQRSAIQRLVKTHSSEVLRKVIASLPRSNSMDYMPVITTPLQLEDKFAQLATAWQKIKNNRPIIL